MVCFLSIVLSMAEIINDQPPPGSGSLAVTGKSLCSRSLTVCGNIPKNVWILDSGVTNHMTFDSTLLCSYTTPSSIPYITVADGSHACVVGTGNIDLQPPFQLQSVLHVPTLSHNLISIHKLTRDLNCKVIFSMSHCVFQDLTTGQTIGIAKEKERLYYFSDDHPKGENISDLESESESESEFLILGPSLPRTPISVPSLEPELSPSLSLSPSSTPESEPVSVPGPSRPSVLQESAPPAPTLVYQRRSKPDLLQKQIQSPEPEKKHPGLELKEVLWAAARETTIPTWEKANAEDEYNEIGCMERYVRCPCFPLEKSTFMDTYSNIMYPANGPQLWPVDDPNTMAPPAMRRAISRPKK
ncbi:hypothetical protein KIW84_065298 [Lathyrus oleraceus]|uniref:Retrovirus-related Pol polyprotein from transposon TNT 1-94-like beta-barrel domain-containing protein n=1 Tax=Pisum sativum TaxID=3888 RepID=A0A9D5A9Z7_PEA|nr:hypothetical protein KIW84_065298 [Pisum sativum]